MTLEEAKNLAMQGNLDAIMALGGYYFGQNSAKENEDIDEAIKWYEKGAEFGYSNCMILASILYNINGHVIRKITGGNPGILHSIESLQKGLYWANKAKSAGEKDADGQLVSLKGELGISYYYYALGGDFSGNTENDKVNRFSESIKLLKSVYRFTQDPEVYIILALCLNGYGELKGYSEENNRLEYSLYHKCADEYFGQVIHSDIAAAYLGIMYIEGRGCPVDHNQAYSYLTKAHNAGFDCSDLLSRFKRKTFGGYVFK